MVFHLLTVSSYVQELIWSFVQRDRISYYIAVTFHLSMVEILNLEKKQHFKIFYMFMFKIYSCFFL